MVKRATSIFNSFCGSVAKQVACFLLSVFPYLKTDVNTDARFSKSRASLLVLATPLMCESLAQATGSAALCLPLDRTVTLSDALTYSEVAAGFSCR